MADHLLDATKKMDCISREEVLELIDNAPIIAGSENETLISAPELSDKVYCLPAADVVEVVRCKDCKYYNSFFHNGFTEKYCGNHSALARVEDNGFCHHAKRRADNG